ncbi:MULTISPECIES: cytochrome o ubiquinol oxidase subunit I [Agrobacterium tumefaciens complex]|jgi:cytochrome o ubiquinol oxidase subunit 1|uniref:Cytochrome o ubiquinol oxidase, subunit I (Ubiquinol oxidase chain A) n=1 Tax=Agrobacterium tumefaciens str. Kerr 14 TaxID=1183424 RepID=A0A1S7NJJ0_AGRTU|nr:MULTISPECIES: cytochrome o ubiquinol oxidase subunit I [Agrobacterium tumefaciens complex]AYM82600.1 cytochrome o ubiquinol oxidase subunit I [Agrobacterium tumefaciens]EHH04731.1 cytochrome ubiquinol oxidase subunit I [Agrobacterium tumefaciens CCNWGS0286]MBB4404489.1 cytochrome o ubiquinol oxidase subunit 1 [Agrobacterium radiobacter]MBB4452104.1 cytochrome o ubiquinol oxidase subunit 1 [Agrobacterium radiobacter]MBP2536913.1 cytochrome o ubiquinol oxidase subunit 1 [Agrobacterium tumefac
MIVNSDQTSFLFGKLTWESIPLHEPILVATFAAVALGGIAVVGALTYFRLWGYLWNEWFTSIDHKKIGIMYIILALVMLLRGFADAIMMRVQQAIASGGSEGYLPPHHYDQIFTAHGVIMIFFMAMPMITGLMNFVVPLQIGARDVSFPFLNNFSFWMTTAGAVITMISLFIGEYAQTGWLAYPPLSGIDGSPGVGVDYYIWGLQIAGVGTTLSGINLIVTIIKMRAPGMTMMRLPIFVWTSLCSNILIVASFPILTGTLALLTLDRYVGTNFFTNDLGGNPMMYVNLIWIWGHPEVYILVLPAFGVFSEIVSTFSNKRLFGYASMVYATGVITILAYIVWLHHFFTMGSGASVNAFFGITTMIISIPTGAKIFNWLFTMYKGRIKFDVPMLWTIGFMITFVIGGMTGVLLAVPPADFVLHNSLFLIAHFHNTIIGGVVFGVLAGIVYWFPKAFGYRLDPFWGKLSFWFWFIGFYFAFMPLYILGLMGITRRISQFEDNSLQIWFLIAAFGAFLIALGIASFVIQLIVSFLNRDKLRDVTGDPYNGRTLEWSTSSPPPAYNFAFTPVIHDVDAWADMKKRGYNRPKEGFIPIHMPKNTGAGVIISAISVVLGFALVWHIWWLAALSMLAIIAVSIAHTFNYNRDYYIPASDVSTVEAERTKLLAEQA